MIHTVASGESLSLIARRYGLANWQALYYAPQNAAFRAARPDPDRIRVGDRLQIPSGGSGAGPGASTPTTTTPRPAAGNGAGAGPANGAGAATRPANGGGAAPRPAAGGGAAPRPAAGAGTGTTPAGPSVPISIANIMDGTWTANAKFVEFLLAATGTPEAERTKNLDALGKLNDGKACLLEFFKAFVEFERGNYVGGTAALLKAFAKLWKAMPSGMREGCVRSVSRVIGRLPKLGRLAQNIPALDKIDALPSFLLLIAALIETDARAARDAAKDFVKAMADNPAEAAKVGGNILAVFLDLLPASVARRLMLTSAGRKVPVLGTVVVGIFDVVAIIRADEQSDRVMALAGLGSTVAGLFPGAGTVISIAMDLGIAIGACIVEINKINVKPTSSPLS